MSSVLQRLESLPEWGIEPVPERERKLSGVDIAVLWGDLGIGLLVLVTGALLVPALGFSQAALAVILGSLIGVALLSLAAAAGAEQAVPTMVLFRPVLGLRGSWLPSVFNFLQLVGWTAVELWAMSLVADLLIQRLWGISARPLWVAAAALICALMAIWGPVGVTRVWMERFAAWMIAGICVVVTVLVLTSGGIGDALASRGSGGWPTLGLALDLVIAMPISWFPLVADYTRFARRPSGALFGTFAGYLMANVWLYLLGALLVLTAGAEPSPAGIAAGILAIAGGSLAGVVFLLGLLAGETDEAFANIYSAAISVQNVFPRLSQKLLTVAIAAVAALLAAWLTMERYESFLFLIGSLFIPLLGVFTADYFFRRRRRITTDDLYRARGRYWFRRGVRGIALLPWAAGFLVYHWIAPSGPGWWTESIAAVFGTPLYEEAPWLSASLPAFAVSFLISLVLPKDASDTTDIEETRK